MTLVDTVAVGDNMGTVTATDGAIAVDHRYVAHNYSPLPVVAASADGAWITDIEGHRYLDCLAAYSAVNFGHRNPEITAVAHAQLDSVTLVSRAFHSDRLGPFCEALAELCGKDMVLPMNSGAEAVESGIKVARKWGTDVKRVPAGEGNIVVAHNNFHGRTTTIISFSDDETARRGFGPYTPGFRSVPFGDAEAVAAAVDDNTVAVLLEPIQGEAGIIVPPDDFLPRVRALCTERNVLMVADEIQSGLARTGRTFACEHWGVVPDIYLLGKALGGGVVPLSAVVANRDILGVLHPGRTRLHVRWQPVGGGDRHDGGGDASARRISVALSRTRRPHARASAFPHRLRRRHCAWHGAVGRRGHRPSACDRQADQPENGRTRCAG